MKKPRAKAKARKRSARELATDISVKYSREYWDRYYFVNTRWSVAAAIFHAILADRRSRGRKK